MKRTLLLASAMAVTLVSASGCSSFRQAMGVDKQPPDEYTVVESAPLTMPPDFGLRPPATFAGRPAESSPQAQAQATVFTAGGDQSPASDANANLGNVSPGEAALLSQAGAANADSGIRDQIDQDNSRGLHSDASLIHRILFWHKTSPTDQTLDAQKESERIDRDVSSGKPIAGGPAPAIQRTNRTIFDML